LRKRASSSLPPPPRRRRRRRRRRRSSQKGGRKDAKRETSLMRSATASASVAACSSHRRFPISWRRDRKAEDLHYTATKTSSSSSSSSCSSGRGFFASFSVIELSLSSHRRYREHPAFSRSTTHTTPTNHQMRQSSRRRAAQTQEQRLDDVVEGREIERERERGLRCEI
jgi:hypothetical protein